MIMICFQFYDLLFSWCTSSLGCKTTGYRKKWIQDQRNFRDLFTVSLIIGKPMLDKTTMPCVGSFGNILTIAFIRRCFSSRSDGKRWTQPPTQHLCVFGCLPSAWNNIMCNVCFKSSSPTFLCIHPPPNITKLIMYALNKFISFLIYRLYIFNRK